MTRRDTSTETDPNRRTDLRTVEEQPHYSASEVYAALGCPYPGTEPDERASFKTPAGAGIAKLRENDRRKEPGGGTPVPSATSGISVYPSSCGCAVRRGSRSRASRAPKMHDNTDDGGPVNTNSHPADPTAQHRPMTDGGIERADTDDADLSVGARVVDRDATDPNLAVVVALPEEPAYAVHIDALDGSPSVADLNPEYGASGPVATVAYAGDLDAALDVWREADAAALAGICADHDVRTYDFPVERLRPAVAFSSGGDAA